MIKKTLKKELFFLYLACMLVIAAFPFFIFGPKKAFIPAILSVMFYIVSIDIVFRIAYRAIKKRSYSIIPKVPFKKMYIEPHPYLPYVYKKHFTGQKAMTRAFPLNRDRGYVLGELKTNNFRHINGPAGDRDIEVPKPEGLIRVNCLGASTTASYLLYEGRIYSYPMELERILKEALPGLDIEVNNCGQGGYTTAEVLIKFLLDTIDTKPDIVVIYHGYNDLGASLTSGFKSDYSHARMNLGEVYHLYRLASKIPGIPLPSWNFLVNYCIFSQNTRYSIPQAISKGDFDIENNFNGLDTYRRNITHIIDIAKANGIHVVLSTFCHHTYDAIKHSKEHMKYLEGLKLENGVMRDLAVKYKLPLVDNNRLIPQENRYFVDNVHFSHEGMELLAKNIAEPVIRHITSGKKTMTGDTV